MLTCTHSLTVTTNVIELLVGYIPLSVAQTSTRFVVLPWAQAGVQRKMPLVVMAAPAGLRPRLNVIGSSSSAALLVMTNCLPTATNWLMTGLIQGGTSTLNWATMLLMLPATLLTRTL